MMAARIDRAAKAGESIEYTAALLSLGATDKAQLIATVAVAEAALALVEQQRIANLIALYTVDDTAVSALARAGIDFRAAALQISEGLGL